MERSENELVELAKNGDRDAFDVLVRGCAGQIYGLAFRLSGNTADAEDLAQSTFIKAFKNIRKFKQESSFSTWVYRITVNLWKNKVKYEKRRGFLRLFSINRTIETEDDEITPEPQDPGPGPDRELEKKQKSMKVQEVLNSLDENVREMIVLRDVEGRTYEEIAELAKVPLGTVKSRLSRAREILRQKFLEHFKDGKNGL